MNGTAKKWLSEYAKLLDKREGTCPVCGSHNMDYGYETSHGNNESGFGAVWCEDCRNAFVLCRVILKYEKARAKILPTLPTDLKFV